jgi:hypothetical protein
MGNLAAKCPRPGLYSETLKFSLPLSSLQRDIENIAETNDNTPFVKSSGE